LLLRAQRARRAIRARARLSHTWSACAVPGWRRYAQVVAHFLAGYR